MEPFLPDAETRPVPSGGPDAPAGPQRIHMMDELRGFAVLCMVFYHAFYTMAMLFDFELGKTLLYFFMPAEPYFAGLFILIAGVSSQLSHSNTVRGLKLLGVALLVTLVTVLFLPDSRIVFGILHMLSLSMILFGLLKPAFDQIPTWLGLLLSALLFLFTMEIGGGFLGLPGLAGWRLPEAWFSLPFLFPFGIRTEDFFSADYFPLFPWIFVYLFGTFLGRFAREGKFPRFLYPSRVPPLSFLGKHALAIYIFHQPVIYGIMWVVSLLIYK